MNATELYHQDGKSAGIFYCAKCRCVSRTKEDADKCCEPRKCQKCGCVIDKYHTLCAACCSIERAEKERERFEKAEKITSWDGWVYLEGTGNDGFSESIEAFLEEWEENHEESEEKPKYVWACQQHCFAVADVSDLTERIVDNAYADFEIEDLNGLEELKEAIEKFNAANKSVVSYDTDYSKAVLL